MTGFVCPRTGNHPDACERGDRSCHWPECMDPEGVDEGAFEQVEPITRLPLTIVAPGGATEGVLVGVLASDLDRIEARLRRLEEERPWEARDYDHLESIYWGQRKAHNEAVRFIQHIADLPIKDGPHIPMACGCPIHQAQHYLEDALADASDGADHGA